MSIVRKIEIDGQDVLFKASAAIPRIYRLKFQRDIYKDLRILEKSIGEGDEENSNLDLFSLRCSRISPTRWRSTPTRRFPMKWTSGWTVSTHFQYTKSCRN